MTREEKIALLIDELEDIRCDNFDADTDEDKTLKEVVRVIKALEQEPILDKIRDEIETKYGQCDICEYFENYDYEENDISEYRPIGNIADILQIIDGHKSESKEK